MTTTPCPYVGDHSKVEHPSATCYRTHGCRCDGCKALRRIYMAQYRAKRVANAGIPLRTTDKPDRPTRTSASGAVIVNGSDLRPNTARDRPGPAPVPLLTEAEIQELRRRLGVKPEHIGPYASPRGKREPKTPKETT